MANSWRKLLVIRFSSIGDIIQTTSVLNTIKKYYPDCRIDFLTLKKYKPLLVNHSSIIIYIQLMPLQVLNLL